MILNPEKVHWGERWYENSDGSGQFGPPLVASVKPSGLVFMKKTCLRSRIRDNKLIGIDINCNIWTKEQGVIRDDLGTDLNEYFQPPQFKKERDIDYRVNAKEIKLRIGLFLDAMPGRKILQMVTISFPKNTLDEQAMLFRNRWETALRKAGWLRHFLWIAERQKNGTIHFHFAVFNRVNIQRLNGVMREILRKASERGELEYSSRLIAKYNGVDLAKNKKTGRVFNFAQNRRALSNYLTKYMTKKKSADYPPNNFTGRAWGCSQSLSSLITRFGLTKQDYEEMKDKYATELEYVPIADNDLAQRIDFYKWKGEIPIEIRELFAGPNLLVITNWERRRGIALDYFTKTRLKNEGFL